MNLATKESKVSVQISDEDIQNIYISFCEGGGNYWADSADGSYEGVANGTENAVIYYRDEDGEDEIPLTITREDIAQAIVKFAVQRFLDEIPDAGEADCVIQMAAFGEIIYG